MGSVQSSGVGASVWAKVQSGGVSIGAHEQPSGASRPSTAGDGDDDGSGMAWVKKRRQRKEQEQKKTESTDKQTNRATDESPPAAEPHASGSDPDPPATKEEAADDRTLSASPTQMNAPLPEATGTPTKEEHHLQAVKLPPVHHHHHRGHSHSTLERQFSGVKVEAERRDSADTLRVMRSPSAQESEKTAVEVVAPSEDARPRTESVISTGSSSSSSSGNDDADAEADEEDLESPRDGEDEDDEDIDAELEVRRFPLYASRRARVCDLPRPPLDDRLLLITCVLTTLLLHRSVLVQLHAALELRRSAGTRSRCQRLVLNKRRIAVYTSSLE